MAVLRMQHRFPLSCNILPVFFRERQSGASTAPEAVCDHASGDEGLSDRVQLPAPLPDLPDLPDSPDAAQTEAATAVPPAARRQKMAAAAGAGAEPAVEETTTVEVYGFHKDWLNPLY